MYSANLKITTIWYFIAITIIFVILSIPFKDGLSMYAYNELIRDLDVIKNLDNGHIITIGPLSSLGNFNFGPAYYYVMYPFVKILNFHPLSLAITSAIFMYFTIIGIFILTKKWFQNEIVAIITSTITTFSILTFQLTKYASNPNFIPFFTVIFFYSLRELILNPKKTKFVFMLAVSTSILTQLHAVTLVVVPLYILFAYIIMTKKPSALNIIIFFIIFIGLYSPYLVGEVLSGYTNSYSLFHLANINPLADYSAHLFQYLTFFINPIISVHGFFDTLFIGGIKFILLIFILLICLPIIIHINLKHRRYYIKQKIQIDQITKKIIFLWLVIPTLLFILPLGKTGDYHIYYFFILIPLIFMILGFGFYKLLEKGLHYTAYFAATTFLLLQIIQYFLYIKTISLIQL